MLFVCMGKTLFGGICLGNWVQWLHACEQHFHSAMCRLPSSQPLASGSGVFYLQGTTNECVPTTILGPLSTLDCVAIRHGRSYRAQLCPDCPPDPFMPPPSHMRSLCPATVMTPWLLVRQCSVSQCQPWPPLGPPQHPREEVLEWRRHCCMQTPKATALLPTFKKVYCPFLPSKMVYVTLKHDSLWRSRCQHPQV